jgi:VWFA-related protein
MPIGLSRWSTAMRFRLWRFEQSVDSGINNLRVFNTWEEFAPPAPDPRLLDEGHGYCEHIRRPIRAYLSLAFANRGSSSFRYSPMVIFGSTRINYRSGILAPISFMCSTASLVSTAVGQHSMPVAKALVWVRDERGAPVSDLNVDDFAVTENGVLDRVVGVERFFSGTQMQSENVASRANGAIRLSQNANDSADLLTHILILIPPMTAVSRYHTIADALHFFSSSRVGNWKVALVDDEGNFLRYSQNVDGIRAALKRLGRHNAPYANRSDWSAVMQSSLRELGVLPGRHVIIFISNHDRLPSSMLVGLAVSAQAAMYTIDSSGPTTVVPFGGAGAFQSSEAGPIPLTTGESAAESLSSVLSLLGYTDTGIIGQFGSAAEETGGLSVNSLKEAFEHISADAAGYYLLSFEAQARESGGTFSTFSVAARKPHLKLNGPRYYMIPPDAAAGQMPADMNAALESAQNQKGISSVANSWLFPDQGSVHWGVFAADLSWPEGEPQKGSSVKIYAELINDSMHGLSGAWFEEKAWPSQAAMLHWQRDGRVYQARTLSGLPQWTWLQARSLSAPGCLRRGCSTRQLFGLAALCSQMPAFHPVSRLLGGKTSSIHCYWMAVSWLPRLMRSSGLVRVCASSSAFTRLLRRLPGWCWRSGEHTPWWMAGSKKQRSSQSPVPRCAV